MRRAFFLVLLLALCFPATASAQARCKVDPWRFENNQTVPIAISMPNDGKPCKVRKFSFQGGSEAVYTVSTPPSNGDIEIKENEAFYTPRAGFSGTDKFVLNVNGTAPFARPATRSGQFEVTVTVATP